MKTYSILLVAGLAALLTGSGARISSADPAAFSVVKPPQGFGATTANNTAQDREQLKSAFQELRTDRDKALAAALEDRAALQRDRAALAAKRAALKAAREDALAARRAFMEKRHQARNDRAARIEVIMGDRLKVENARAPAPNDPLQAQIARARLSQVPNGAPRP